MSTLVEEFRERVKKRALEQSSGVTPPVNFLRGPGGKSWLKTLGLWKTKKSGRIRLARAA